MEPVASWVPGAKLVETPRPNPHRFVQCALTRPWSLVGAGHKAVGADLRVGKGLSELGFPPASGHTVSAVADIRDLSLSGMAVIVFNPEAGRNGLYYVQMASQFPGLRDYYEAPYFHHGSAPTPEGLQQLAMRSAVLQTLFRAHREAAEKTLTPESEGQDRAWTPPIVQTFSSRRFQELASVGEYHDFLYCPDGELGLFILLWRFVRFLKARLGESAFPERLRTWTLGSGPVDDLGPLAEATIPSTYEAELAEEFRNIAVLEWPDRWNSLVTNDHRAFAQTLLNGKNEGTSPSWRLNETSDELMAMDFATELGWLGLPADCEPTAREGSIFAWLKHFANWCTIKAWPRNFIPAKFDPAAQTAGNVAKLLGKLAARTEGDVRRTTGILRRTAVFVLDHAGQDPAGSVQDFAATLETEIHRAARAPLAPYFVWRRCAGRDNVAFLLGHMAAPIGDAVSSRSLAGQEHAYFCERTFIVAGVDESSLAEDCRGSSLEAGRLYHQPLAFVSRLRDALLQARAVFSPLADSINAYTLFQRRIADAKASELGAATGRVHQNGNFLQPILKIKLGSTPSADEVEGVVLSGKLLHAENMIYLSMANGRMLPPLPREFEVRVSPARVVVDTIKDYAIWCRAVGRVAKLPAFAVESENDAYMRLPGSFLRSLLWEICHNYSKHSPAKPVVVLVEIVAPVVTFTFTAMPDDGADEPPEPSTGLGHAMIRQVLGFLMGIPTDESKDWYRGGFDQDHRWVDVLRLDTGKVLKQHRRTI